MGSMPLPFGRKSWPSSAEELIEENVSVRLITSRSGSQATLFAVGTPEMTSELVWECKTTFNLLAEKRNVTFIWISCHAGMKGNENGNQQAKSVTASEYIGLVPILGLTSCWIGII